jgi:hypothetical protein
VGLLMVEEDIVQEYIQAMKYHVDHNCLILKEVNKIHREVVKYIKEKKKEE